MGRSSSTGRAGSIRGAALREFALWHAAEHGPDPLLRAIASLPAEEARCFDTRKRDLGLSKTAWYPLTPVHRILDHVTADLDPAAVDDLARRAAQAIMDAYLKGLLRALFRFFVSPEVCVLFSQPIWNAFFDSGRSKIEKASPTTHHMRVRDWNGHHPFLCALNNGAGVPLYGAAGCRNVTTELAACVDRGDDECLYVIRWTP